MTTMLSFIARVVLYRYLQKLLYVIRRRVRSEIGRKHRSSINKNSICDDDVDEKRAMEN